ncbi:hypothetical protein ACIA8O_04445 [Kitasatospora sp. NPDC051853]|uniref:hypothetical protein n=1 Tax=Kitasatospora sp. NPDC051853 TaxID=3364058 RepID=UPI0037B3A28B
MAAELSEELGGPPQWFWCLDHQRVEEGYQCPVKNLLGPFDTPAEAARALDLAHGRTEEWDRSDRAWEEGEG